MREVVEKKQLEDEFKPSSSSTQFFLCSLTSDDNDQTDMISSLAKLIEKNRKVKSLQRTLMEVIDRLHCTLVVQHTEEDLLKSHLYNVFLIDLPKYFSY